MSDLGIFIKAIEDTNTDRLKVHESIHKIYASFYFFSLLIAAITLIIQWSFFGWHAPTFIGICIFAALAFFQGTVLISISILILLIPLQESAIPRTPSKRVHENPSQIVTQPNQDLPFPAVAFCEKETSPFGEPKRC